MKPTLRKWAGPLAALLLAATPAMAIEPAVFFFARQYALTVFDGLSGMLVGTNGFRLAGADAEHRFGASVAGPGDINGDGYDDLLIGAPFVDAGPGFRVGRAYVLYGHPGYFESRQIPQLAGTNGFQFTGAAADNQAGSTVAGCGDFNRDGFQDLAIAAPRASFPGRTNAGAVYIVLGGTNLPANPSPATLDGTNGLTLAGAASAFFCGSALAGAGDFNGDGFADMLVGAGDASPAATTNAGRAYLVYGSAARPPQLDLGSLGATQGFYFAAEDTGDRAGTAVCGVGDYNGDGLDDIAIGAPTAPDFFSAGRAYVVFGTTNRPASLALNSLNGTNGFRVDGAAFFGQLGMACAGADLNQDGLADVILGAPNLNRAYVILGRTNAPPVVNVAGLNGSNGCVLVLTNAAGNFGTALAGVPDLNGDGYADLLCGAPSASPGSLNGAGETYLILGRSHFAATVDVSQATGTNGCILAGVQALAEAGSAVSSAGDYNGDGFTDVVLGARLFDFSSSSGGPVTTNAGAAYVLSSMGIAGQIYYRPECTAFSITGITAQVTWQGQPGVTYEVFTNGVLPAGTWGLAGAVVSAGSTNVFTAPAGNSAEVFYRVAVSY